MTESHYVKASDNISVKEVSQATGTFATFIAVYRTILFYIFKLYGLSN